MSSSSAGRHPPHLRTPSLDKINGSSSFIDSTTLHLMSVGNNSLPQLPRVCGGMSGQQQQERMHATKRQ